MSPESKLPVLDRNVTPLLPPIAVGGVGGSGTRLVSQLLHDAGIFMGGDVNDAGDNLWFTLLFKHEAILTADEAQFDLLLATFIAAMTGGGPLSTQAQAATDALAGRDRLQHPSDWLLARADSLRAHASRSRPALPWGWKEPNTHVVLEQLWQRMPQLRYIHVVRHGMDMAYSRNQNQLHLWGRHVLGADYAETPGGSLAYWCQVHRRMWNLLQRNPDRMYWLDYDALCADPVPILADLARFTGLDALPLSPTRPILPPRMRHATWMDDDFDDVDVEFVRSLGYHVEPRSCVEIA